MNLEEKSKEFLEEKLESIKNDLIKGKVNKEDFKNLIEDFKDLQSKILELIEWANELKKDDDLVKLHQRFSGYKSSDLIDQLRNRGYSLSNNEDLKKDFEQQGFRLLEQIRTGNRDVVFYTLLRIFITRKMTMPKIILEAFKPIYSEQLFKIFLFSFLSGLLGKEINL